MRPSRRARRASIVACLAVALLHAAMARASIGTTADRDLYLETFINGASTKLIGQYRQRADGRMAITAQEMSELGLDPAGLRAAPDGFLDLDALPGLTYRYDAAAQAIRIEATDARRKPYKFDARDWQSLRRETAEPARSLGAVVNYRLYGTTQAEWDFFPAVVRTGALSATFDARAFGPFGVISQSAIAGLGPDAPFVRLDTTWSYSDPSTLVTYRAGDTISGGLPWTRPVRLGGVQVERSFALRPDLVTLPLPQFAGSAKVPSTLDLYVNNVQTYSREVPAGPFQLGNIPIVSGAGTAQVVLRDASGRESVTNLPFYASSRQLAGGLFDFSAEVGARRVSYGTASYDYDPQPVGSASARYGVTDWLTLEAHAEGAAQLANGGIGAVFPVANFAVASLALAGSRYGADTGAQLSAAIEFGFRGWSFYARTQRTFGDYTDLAALPARLPGLDLPLALLRPAKAIDQAALSVPLGFDPAMLTLSLTRVTDARDYRYDILGASFSRPLTRNASLYASAFSDLGDRRNAGGMLGLSVSFADGISATASAASTRNGPSGGVEVVKAQPLEPGTYGWRLRDREGAYPERYAAASYRAPFARVEAGAQQFGGVTRVTGEAEGAVALLAGDVFFANRIDDSFAVVDAGAQDVDVTYENRPVGRTNRNGLLLVPYLKAWQPNQLAIDGRNLPIDAEIARTRQVVVPPDRSGAVVSFGITTQAATALIVLRDASGKPLAPGARGKLAGSGEEFAVGYDGNAFIRGLGPQNTVMVELADGRECRASFPFVPRPGAQVVIDPVVCR